MSAAFACGAVAAVAAVAAACRQAFSAAVA